MVTADLEDADTMHLKKKKQKQCAILKINHQEMLVRVEMRQKTYDRKSKVTRRDATKKKAQACMKICKAAG